MYTVFSCVGSTVAKSSKNILNKIVIMQTFVCICVVGAQPLKIHDSENTKDFIVVKINRVLKQGKLAIKAIICPSCTCMFCSLMFLLPYLVLSRFLFKHIHSLTSKRCWNIQTASCYCVFHLHTVYEKLALFANVLFSYTNCVLAHEVWTSCRSYKNEHLNPFFGSIFLRLWSQLLSVVGVF